MGLLEHNERDARDTALQRGQGQPTLSSYGDTHWCFRPSDREGSSQADPRHERAHLQVRGCLCRVKVRAARTVPRQLGRTNREQYNRQSEERRRPLHRLAVAGLEEPQSWGRIIKWVREYLLHEGYFTEEERDGIAKLLGKKLVPQCGRIVALEREARQLREMMAAFQAHQSELYTQLWKGVALGIASRRKRAGLAPVGID